MNRRAFLLTLIPLSTHNAAAATQFDVSGTLERTGLEGEGYYAISQNFGLHIHPQKLPSLYQQAENLVGKPARVKLEAA